MKLQVISYDGALKLECPFNKNTYIGSRACAKCSNFISGGAIERVRFVECSKPDDLLQCIKSIQIKEN